MPEPHRRSLRRKEVFPTNKKKLANRIFSVVGLTVGAVILIFLIFYVRRTMDLRALLQSVQPRWLVAAALCIPASVSIDALLFYGMGKSAGSPVRLLGCFETAFIGEFYYKLGPAGAPVQVKLLYDAGMSGLHAASVYIWKMVANIMLYAVYALVALVYVMFVRKFSLGGALAGLIAMLILYAVLCGLAAMMAIKPEPLLKLIRRLLGFLSRKIKALGKPGRVDSIMGKVEDFAGQLRTFKDNRRLLVGLYVGMAVDLGILFSIPYCIYRGLGLQEETFFTLLLLQAMVMIIARIVVLPGNVGGAEGSFYLFMAPVFGEKLAVAMVLWRFTTFVEILLIGGVWSVVRFAMRSARLGRDNPK